MPMFDRRLTLRLSMAMILAWGILLAWICSQGSVGYALVVVSHSIIAWGFCFVSAFVVPRIFGPIVRGRGGRALVSSCLTIAVLASLYVAWGYHRAIYDSLGGLNQGLPYPDPAINALLRWFDARNPVHPGSLKVHGEFPRVTFVLGMLVLIGASLSGFLLGILCNQSKAEWQELRDSSEP
jgi:hypothetical protein